MAMQELHRSKIASLHINLRNLGATHGMGAVGTRLETDGDHPVRDEANILPRRNVQPSVKLALSECGAVLAIAASARASAIAQYGWRAGARSSRRVGTVLGCAFRAEGPIPTINSELCQLQEVEVCERQLGG